VDVFISILPSDDEQQRIISASEKAITRKPLKLHRRLPFLT